MKLLNYTSRYFLLLIIALLAVLCALLYFSIKGTVSNDIDEYLMSRQIDVVQAIRKNPEILNEKSIYHKDFDIERIPEKDYVEFLKKHRAGKIKDTEYFNKYEKEDEPFRKIEFVLGNDGKYYKITLIASLLNSEELLLTILADILFFSIILIVFVVILNRILLGRIWKPFYINIQRINNYRLDKDKEIHFESSNILEFQELNHSLEKLIQNNIQVFISQKHFIENASHEMQTPLGIIQNKVYMLMEEPTLTSSQAIIIDGITEHIERLSRLNKTLLLLYKIENEQFAEIETVKISSLVESCCEDFSDLIEFKQLDLKIEMYSSPIIHMNVDLAQILFSNIIKNAINHNINNGFIRIYIEANRITLTNSGKKLSVNPEILFERFNKNAESSHSTGLGLAIVKTICNVYDFRVSYSYKENTHSITILF